MSSELFHRWTESRRRTIALLSTIPDSALAFTPLPEYRNIHEMIVHIVATEITVLEGLTTQAFDWKGTTSRLSKQSVAELLESARSADVDLKLLLESTADLDERVDSLSRADWLWLVYEHEAHHRGVLVLMMRLAGLDVIPIYS
ncbi:MAG TPA: DinB family protein [Thermoanaerobaculia bacterium]|nr:DinB family protein [Thermoanaerobaculia bacterium]